ncbi:MAG: hypothetical protein J6Q79_01575 [Clostridia bacterium]|nr:hypothetical protein [Clostridia bacterium]
MKTDRDMAENILNRVTEIKVIRARRKRTIEKIASVTCVLAIVFAMSITFIGNNTPEMPEESTANTTNEAVKANKGFLLMVANAADDEATYYKESDVNIPLGGILQIKNTKGMSREAINRMSYELKLRLEELYGLDDGFQIIGLEEEVAVHFGTADKLRFKLADPSAVDYVTLTCTDNGKLTVFDETAMGKIKEFTKTIKVGNEITITADEYMNIYDKGKGVHIEWFLSESYAKQLTEETPLSEINDTITGKVSYKDGAEELFAITLNFDDEGSLTSTYSSRIAYYPIAE